MNKRRSRLLKLSILKTAADLGYKNIPDMFVASATNYGLQALYWREPAEDEKTIEIWKTTEGPFLVVEGDFSDGEWGQQDISVVSEQVDIRSALSFAEANYMLLQNEEPYEQI